MSNAMVPMAIDLNIDRMRAKIYQEMAEVCKPFYKRLEKLDVVEMFIQEEQRALSRAQGTPQSRGWANRKNNPRQYRRKAKVMKAEPVPQKAIAAPQNGRYSGMSQPQAIMEIVSEEPGLDVPAITQRLMNGGYPFKGTHPVDAMYVAMRQAVQNKKIRQVAPHDDVKTTYYPKRGTIPKSAAKAMGIADRVVNVVANGPDAGVTRKEVLEGVLASGYVFPANAKNSPERTLNWSLQSLVDSRRIHRSGQGSGAMFSRPKISPIENKGHGGV